LIVAYVTGDDLLYRTDEMLTSTRGLPSHSDGLNDAVKLHKNTASFIGDRKRIVSAHTYLCARAIRKGLDEGADIIICDSLY